MTARRRGADSLGALAHAEPALQPTFEDCVAVALSPDAIHVQGRRSTPCTYAVYRVPGAGGRPYRFGAHLWRCNANAADA